MDLKNITLFKALDQRMTWLNERQKVLAQNIANANTPGYISKDLKKVSFQTHLDNSSASNGSSSGLQMKATNSLHIRGAGGISAPFEIREQTADFSETTPDGNTVDLERELAKMAEVQMEYTLASNLYRKHVGMLKTALGKR